MNPTKVSIVVLGNWNPKIFTPQWVKTQIFGVKITDEIQGMVNFEDMDFAFSHEGITIAPKTNLVEIFMEDFRLENCKKMAEIVINLLNILPQTPLKGMGVNFRYIFNADETNEFIIASKERMKDFGELSLNQIRFSSQKKGFTLNILNELLNSNEIAVSFNFHYSRVEDFTLESTDNHYTETQKILNNGN
jgi:hypothetical protein